MRQLLRRVCALWLLLASLTALFSCELSPGEEESPYTGITIAEDPAPSETAGPSTTTEDYAKAVVGDLLTHALVKTGAAPLFTTEERRAMTETICAITTEIPLAEGKYLLLLRSLEERGREVINEILGGDGGEACKALYLALSAELGSDYISRTLYRLLLFACDCRHDQAMANYEKHGDRADLIAAGDARARKSMLTDEIGEEKFATLLQSVLVLPEMLFGDALEDEAMDAFTEEEILLFLEEIELSELHFTTQSWELLLSLLVPKKNTSATAYPSKLLYVMEEAEDTVQVASVMNDVIDLLVFLRDGLSAEDIALLREGNRNAVLSRAFSTFSETEWACFERITAVHLMTAKYEAEAKRVYGSAFTAYKSTVGISSLSDLRGAVGTTNFYNVLEGYIAGISPAFSYGMKP